MRDRDDLLFACTRCQLKCIARGEHVLRRCTSTAALRNFLKRWWHPEMRPAVARLLRFAWSWLTVRSAWGERLRLYFVHFPTRAAAKRSEPRFETSARSAVFVCPAQAIERAPGDRHGGRVSSTMNAPGRLGLPAGKRSRRCAAFIVCSRLSFTRLAGKHCEAGADGQVCLQTQSKHAQWRVWAVRRVFVL